VVVHVLAASGIVQCCWQALHGVPHRAVHDCAMDSKVYIRVKDGNLIALTFWRGIESREMGVWSHGR
jgi:hypothetical protein